MSAAPGTPSPPATKVASKAAASVADIPGYHGHPPPPRNYSRDDAPAAGPWSVVGGQRSARVAVPRRFGDVSLTEFQSSLVA